MYHYAILQTEIESYQEKVKQEVSEQFEKEVESTYEEIHQNILTRQENKLKAEFQDKVRIYGEEIESLTKIL